MTVDEVDITIPIMKYCPGCSSKDIIIFDSLLICHKCHGQYNAYEIRDEFDE